MLPIFSLSKVLAKYQKNSKKKLSPDETFNCPYLDKTLLDSCEQMTNAINDASDLFIFSATERSLLAQRRSKLQTWRTNTENSTHSIKRIYDGFKKAYELPRPIASKQILFNWRKQYYVLFANTENWISLIPSPVALNRFHQLKAAWKKQAPFALPSIEAIATIATEWLPSLIDHHQHALKNLWRYYFSIPKHIYTAYQQYLKKFLEQAQQLQQQLAETMYMRLKVFSDTEFAHADIIVHLADQLKIKHPPATDKPNAKQFLQFHQHIQQHGDKSLTQKLHALAWFKSNGTWTLQIASKKSSVIVPQVLTEHTSIKPKKPAWLFKGANLRYELCKKHAFDWVLLQQLPDTTQLQITPNSLENISTTLDKLQESQKIVIRLLNEIRQPPYNKLSIWHWRTHQFLNRYRQLLQEHQQKIISKQLTIAEKLAAHIFIADSDRKIASILKMPHQLGEILRTLLKNIQTAITDCNNPALKNQLHHLQSQYNECLALNCVAELLKATEQGYLLSEVDLNYIKTVLSSFELATHPHWQHFTRQIARAQLKNLIIELKHNPAEMTEETQQTTHHSNIQQQSTILQLLVPKYDIHTITKPLLKYFLYYLNMVLSCNADASLFKKNTSILDKFESTLELFSKTHSIFIGNTTLAEYLVSFKNWRAQKNWIEIQAEAESLAYLLSEERLIKRIDKACDQLNTEIKSLLAQNESQYTKQARYFEGNNMSDNNLTSALALNVSEQLTTHGKQTLDDEITSTLKPREQVMLGITQTKDENENITFIPTLIEINSQAQQLQQIVHDETLSYTEKLSTSFAYQKSFDRTIKTLKQHYNIIPTEFGHSRKSNPLFFKAYTSLTEAPASNSPLPTNLALNS